MGGTEEKENSEKEKRRDEVSSEENQKSEEHSVKIQNRRRIVEEFEEQKKRHSGKSKVFGLSTILIWLVASSPFIVHIKPPTPLPSFVAGSESDQALKTVFDKAINSIFDITSRANKMYGDMNQQYNYYQPAPVEQQQPKMAPFYRPMGLRWRDDQSMMQQYNPVPVMPVLTEHRSASPFGRSSSPSRPTTSNRFDTYSYDSPSLEDADLIDVLWRSDIAIEKGVRQVAPAEQYERDLQMLTEKSTIGLTAEEHARYEDLSKGMFQDFYPSFNNYNSNNNNNNNNNVDQSMKHMVKSQDEVKEYPVPTDEDLAALLEDVSKEESQLNLLFETSSNSQPLLQNVSLSEGIVYSQNNLTEMSMLRNDELSSSSEQQVAPAETLFNSTTDSTTMQQYIMPAEAEPVDVFPPANFAYIPMVNESSHEAVSNGNVEYDHNYAVRSSQQQQHQQNVNHIGAAIASALGGSSSSGSSSNSALSPIFDPYHSMRQSFSDCTDSSSTCSRLSSESPQYNNEAASDPSRGVPTSRFHGKLVPNDYTFGRQSPIRKISRVIPLISQQQRKRGRQSKDEQLASENSLPVSAHQISEMSLSELQQVLKMEKLSEAQKQLIRKIRRRGKNKVAARTCRQRRTDRHDRAMEMSYM